MAKFITLKETTTRNDILVNTSHISKISPDLQNENNVIVRLDGEDICFANKFTNVQKQIYDDTIERCSNNLFHIWEILRARLR